MSKIIKVAGVLVLSAVVLAGCNTIRGVGADIEDGGEAIQDAVN